MDEPRLRSPRQLRRTPLPYLTYLGENEDAGSRRSDPGHTGPADPEGPVAGTTARLRGVAADRADHARRAARRAGGTLPRAVPSRAPGAARRGMGHVG